MNYDISDKDKKDWENFTSGSEKLPNKDLQSTRKETLKTKTIDLHGYTLDNANRVIKEFINKCYSEKVNKIIVITGKGIHSNNEKNPYVSKNFGILKYSIPEYINNNKDLTKLINKIENAGIKDGGEGSFYIFLKKNKIKE